MLEEASIRVHYEQGTKAPLRRKRYLSNPLRKMLNHVDWNASFVSNIPFNEVGSEVRVLCLITEPTHEIMVLIALRKFNLQTRMRSNPLGLYIWFLVRPFVYFHTLYVRTAKALTRLRGCAVSPEPSLFAYAISTIIS